MTKLQYMTINDFQYFNKLTNELESNFNVVNEDNYNQELTEAFHVYFFENIEEDLENLNYSEDAIKEIKKTFFKF